MVFAGFTQRDAIPQLVIDALSVCDKLGATAIVQSFLGLRLSYAEDYVAFLQHRTRGDKNVALFTDPHRAIVYQYLIPTWLSDHDSATLISIAMYLTQSGSNCIDIFANSAGSMAAAAWTAIINNWPENIAGHKPVLKSITTTVLAASLAPHHLADLCSADNNTLVYVTCTHDMRAPCGDPGPGMKRAAKAVVHRFPALQTQIHSMRIDGEPHLLQAAFGTSMHGVNRLMDHATGGNTTHFVLCGGTLTDENGDIFIEDLKTRMPIGDERITGMKESIFAFTLITNAASQNGHFDEPMARQYLTHSHKLRLQLTDEKEARLLSEAEGWQALDEMITATGIVLSATHRHTDVFNILFIRKEMNGCRMHISPYAIFHFISQALPFWVDGILTPTGNQDTCDQQAHKRSKELLAEGKILKASVTACLHNIEPRIISYQTKEWFMMGVAIERVYTQTCLRHHDQAGIAVFSKIEEPADKDVGLHCEQFVEITLVDDTVWEGII